jgi:hypothetical protein
VDSYLYPFADVHGRSVSKLAGAQTREKPPASTPEKKGQFGRGIRKGQPDKEDYSWSDRTFPNLKFQYSMTKTDLEFGISVIVICLIFVIWNLEFSFSHYPSKVRAL